MNFKNYRVQYRFGSSNSFNTRSVKDIFFDNNRTIQYVETEDGKIIPWHCVEILYPLED